MELRKVTAIIRSEKLEQVEEMLKSMHVKGLMVSNVKGYGEYANFFRHDEVLKIRDDLGYPVWQGWRRALL